MKRRHDLLNVFLKKIKYLNKPSFLRRHYCVNNKNVTENFYKVFVKFKMFNDDCYVGRRRRRRHRHNRSPRL